MKTARLTEHEARHAADILMEYADETLDIKAALVAHALREANTIKFYGREENETVD